MSVVRVILDISKKEEPMSLPERGQYLYSPYAWMAYVTEDGNYGSDGVVIYHPEDLTTKQHELMQDMHDRTRIEYVMAILDGNDEEVERIEADYV
jgi:hypothetical protein